MKKLITCLVLVFAVSFSAFAQEEMNTQAIEKNRDYYIHKSKGQQLFAGGFLFASAVPPLIHMLSWDLEPDSEVSKKNDNTRTIITAVCITAAAGWLIASQVNKRKARMMMSSQKLAMGLPYPAGRAVTGISLALPLGK